jgi:hypothetical protein
LVLGDSIGFVDIYQLNGTSYVLLQTLSVGTKVIANIHMTNDASHTYLIAGGVDGYARVYKNIGNVFTLVVQNFTLSVYTVQIVWISDDFNFVLVGTT